MAHLKPGVLVDLVKRYKREAEEKRRKILLPNLRATLTTTKQEMIYEIADRAPQDIRPHKKVSWIAAQCLRKRQQVVDQSTIRRALQVRHRKL